MQHIISLDDTIDFPPRNQKKFALMDFKDGLLKWRIWFLLAYQDIKLRYRRSVLGPFWLTLSMALSVYSMGFLYSHLFHIELKFYFPYLVSGMIAWALISTQVSELTETFILSDGLIKQIKLPYSLYIHRVISRNILIFFHNIIVLLPLMVIFPQSAALNVNSLLIIPCLLLLYVNSFFFGLILAMLGARYRDILQVIKSLIQIIFFLTPVMWRKDILSADKQFIVQFNPFSALVEIIRAPLLGKVPGLFDIGMVLFLTLFGASVCWLMFVRYRSRIVYWL